MDAQIDPEFDKLMEYGQRLLDTSIAVVGAAEIDISSERARDPRVVGLSILCRTISNFRAAMLLIQQDGAMEARVLTRLMYENLLWIAALRERGAAFVQDMLQDEAFNRHALAQHTLAISAKHGADLNRPDAIQLRGLINDLGKQFPTKRRLHADKTAAAGVVNLAYIEYSRLSLDAVHCSITALGRHLSSERHDNTTELVLSVVPRVDEAEMLSTARSACQALLGVCVGANELLGHTTQSSLVGAMMLEFEQRGWQR